MSECKKTCGTCAWVPFFTKYREIDDSFGHCRRVAFTFPSDNEYSDGVGRVRASYPACPAWVGREEEEE